MQDKNYRQMGGVLKTVLDTIERVHQLGFWLEVVTLVIPGFNDSRGAVGRRPLYGLDLGGYPLACDGLSPRL